VLLAAVGALAAAALVWRALQRLQRPVDALIRSAERIGQGDYTRPFEVQRRDGLGELQQALERMRARLRQFTVNKNYLHSVLNSMTDAVFVTSPDGVIKLANSAACKLLGFSEDIYRFGLLGKIRSSAEDQLGQRFVGVRQAIWKKLAEESKSRLVEPFDPERFNSNATIGENLLFGVPVGYSDGFDRRFSNLGVALVRGKRCPVIGRVMMNMYVLDVSHVEGVQAEDEVVLLGSQAGPDGSTTIGAEELAGIIGTIPYEILARISPLLPRRVV